MVFVNNYTRRNFIGSPFGGVKVSGYGREYGPETLHEFVRAKNVRFPSGCGTIPSWPPKRSGPDRRSKIPLTKLSRGAQHAEG